MIYPFLLCKPILPCEWVNMLFPRVFPAQSTLMGSPWWHCSVAVLLICSWFVGVPMSIFSFAWRGSKNHFTFISKINTPVPKERGCVLFPLLCVEQLHSLESKYCSSCFLDYHVKVFSGARTGFVPLHLKGGTHSLWLRNCSQL